MRGDVYPFENFDARGAEQAGPRYAVEVGSSSVSSAKRTIVCPTSSREPELYLTDVHVRIKYTDDRTGARVTSYVLIEQVVAADNSKILGPRVGVVDEMDEIDTALRFVFDLEGDDDD
ncbi:type II toxin-antitoxin system PemK/MazF family toxin [Rhodococcus sp. 05-339-2]|uniref:type II toxin-antitoxin system PemK/MazF family toxin n=1 Tax=Rhodococcoides fascians TaxID=1828 RepID=UPI00050CBEB6|nr:type II toxin-antitoxin system PemK/MazF family toxin [Rhodococcus sp. 05-339-2]